MENKILLLYLNTGGGHLAPAKAVANSLTKNFGSQVEPVLINGFEETDKWVKMICEDGYRYAQGNAKWIYELLYGINKIDFFAKSTLDLVSKHSKEYLQNVILKEKPKKIVIFHAFLIQPIVEIVQESGLDISVITMVTDPFSPSQVWFYNKDMQYIISSKELENISAENNIPIDNLHYFPFPLNDKFSTVLPENERALLKKKYGFKQDEPMVLVIGGADGIANGKKIVKNIFKKNSKVQVAVVCGKNKKLYKKVVEYKENIGLKRLTVYKYIDFVFELLNISDMVITKGGTSTLMEILVSGKIPVINDYIWEQEKGNVEFIVENKVGIYEKNPKKIGKIVRSFTSNKDKQKKIKENQAIINITNGNDEIAKFIFEYSEPKTNEEIKE